METAAIQAVRKAIARLELPAGSLVKVVSQFPVVSLSREALVDVTADVPGLIFDSPKASMRLWSDEQSVEFRFKPAADAVGQVCGGRVYFWLQGVILADVSIGIFVANNEVPEIFRATLAEASAKPYRRVFPSYSHEDAQVVNRLEMYAAAFGDEYMRDVNELRAGQSWSKEIHALIKRADVFQLFWSAKAASSAFVEDEWRHALKERDIRPDPFFVRPVYWTEQPAPIPEELKHLHFVRTPLLNEPGGPSAGTAQG